MIKTLEEYFNFSILIWWIKRALQVANSRRRQTLRFQSNERSVRPHRGNSAADQHGGDTRTVLAHSMYILVHRQQCIEVSITFVCLTSSQDGSSCMSARSRRALISRKSGLCLCVVEAGCYGSAGSPAKEGHRAMRGRKARSCPVAWCNWRRDTAFAGMGRAGQLAIAGRLTVGSSLNGAMVSSVM